MNMDREKLEGMIIDYIDGKLTPEEKVLLEAELVNHQELYNQFREVMAAMDRSAELEPHERMREKFDAALMEEIRLSHRKLAEERKVIPLFSPLVYRIAAAVVLVAAGVSVGITVQRNIQHEEEVAALRKEVETTKRMMIAMLDNPMSASQRLQGANVALTIEKADDDVVKALVKTLNEDPNSNVRLAAMEALGKFYAEQNVRTALISSLSSQKDPVVQIALIQLLVKMKEKNAVRQLEEIIEDNQNIKAVKDEAYTGILKLS